MTLSRTCRRTLLAATAACLLLTTPGYAAPTDPSDPSAPGASGSAGSPDGSEQQPPEQRCAHSDRVYTERREWAGQLTDPQRVWPVSDGSGVTVAVLGTGVDRNNPQLEASRLTSQVDLVAGSPADCVGRGTFAAGIVAAAPVPSTTFTGLAPGARILPIRVTQGGETTGDGTSPDILAAAITVAAAAKAAVILVSEPAKVNSPALDAAVQRAVDAGSVVVSPAAAQQNGRSYPTANPRVLAVGAVDSNGQPTGDESGDYIDVAAPGTGLVSTSAGANGQVAHNWPVESPDFSAAFVAGTVALLRAYHPDLTPQQVINRITLTASRSGGVQDPYRGWGVLDTYGAVTAQLPDDVAGPQAVQPMAVQRRVVPAPGPQEVQHNRAGGLAAVFALVAIGAALAGTATIRRGRNSGWRRGRFR